LTVSNPKNARILFVPAQVRQVTKYDKRAKKLKSSSYARPPLPAALVTTDRRCFSLKFSTLDLSLLIGRCRFIFWA
jgi:hypothetical protein